MRPEWAQTPVDLQPAGDLADPPVLTDAEVPPHASWPTPRQKGKGNRREGGLYWAPSPPEGDGCGGPPILVQTKGETCVRTLGAHVIPEQSRRVAKKGLGLSW